jgi:hypothetical protein
LQHALAQRLLYQTMLMLLERLGQQQAQYASV